MLHIGILIFPEVEVLDFAGPFEVFSIAENNDQKNLCNVFLVSENLSPVKARNGLIVLPNFEYKNCPPMDILIVPGGYGAEEIEIKNQTTLSWIKTKYLAVKHLASICTGAFLLAELGLLNGLEVATRTAKQMEYDWNPSSLNKH